MKIKFFLAAVAIAYTSSFAVDNVVLTSAVSRLVTDVNSIKAQQNSFSTELESIRKEISLSKDGNKQIYDRLVLTQEELSKTKVDIDNKTQGLRDENGNLIGSANAQNDKKINEIRERLLKIEAMLNGSSSTTTNQQSTSDVEKQILDYIK